MSGAEESCSYDPYSAETLADPMAAYAQLRASCPVHRYDGFDPPFFTMSRHDDVAAALRDTSTYSSRFGQGPRATETGGLLSDPPEHTAFRRLLQKAFTPRAVAEMEPFVAGVASDLIDGFIHRGSADLAHELAFPLPAITIATMLGIPPDDRDMFKRWSDALVEELGSHEPQSRREERRGLGTYIREQVDQRRLLLEQGADLPAGLISSLVEAEDSGHTMSASEILGVIVQLLVGGNETTASLITNALIRLLERPHLLDRVRGDLSLIDAVIEESLRFDAPVLGLFRTTTDDVTTHGTTIPAGAKVMLMYGSANRDEAAFDDADEFKLDRSHAESRRHLGFGAGVHYCLGASLARIEARHALRGAISRLPGLRLAGRGERVEAFYLWGRRTLPVAWDVTSQ